MIILQIAGVCYQKDKKRKELFVTCIVIVHIILTSTKTPTLEVNMKFFYTEQIVVVSLVHKNVLSIKRISS